VPSLLELLKDMSSYNPSRRITAAAALTRLRALRATIPNDTLNELEERQLLNFPEPPRSCWIMFRDILETGHWAVGCQFMWRTFKTWFVVYIMI
jgi:hypothetical protein